MACGCFTVLRKYISLTLICCLSSFVFAWSLVICWQNVFLHHRRDYSVNVSPSTQWWHSSLFSLWAPHHTLSSLCACYNLSLTKCARPFLLRKPLILSLECLYALNSVATAPHCQLHTLSNYKLLEKTFCSPQQKCDSTGYCRPICSRIMKSLFSFPCLVLHVRFCFACCFMFTQSVWPADLGRNASSGVNVRTAASVTDKLEGAAAAPAGLESTVRKVSQWVSTEAVLMNLQKLWLHGKCCTMETVKFFLIITSNLQFTLLSLWTGPVWHRL